MKKIPWLCPTWGPGKHANHTIGVAKIRFMADTTILDHCEIVLRIPDCKSVAMLAPGKHANHTMGGAKIREFTTKGVYTGTVMQTRPFWTILEYS